LLYGITVEPGVDADDFADKLLTLEKALIRITSQASKLKAYLKLSLSLDGL